MFYPTLDLSADSRLQRLHGEIKISLKIDSPEHFEDAYESIPTASKMDLKTALEECTMALNLFLNNKFSEALDMLRPWAKASMYHALGYSTILVMQAAMTFEHQDIQMGISVMKDALQTCQRDANGYDLAVAATILEVLLRRYLEGEFGLSQLREGASSHSLRAILSVLTLLLYHTYVALILGCGEGNLVEAEALLEPYLKKFPNGSIILFYTARIAVLKGNFEKAEVKFQDCIASQQEWKQIHHLCYWELMWCHTFQQNWLEAYRYADLLCKESKWSKAIYVFQKAAILSMLPGEVVTQTGENVTELFKQVEGLKQKIAGKSIPTEKFAVRKSRRYSAPKPVKLVVPALGMMYVWNGFTIVGKRADHTESLLITIEQAEVALNQETNPTEYHPDDQCLIQMLKGLCLKHLGRLLQAELCFTQVTTSEKRIKYDHYLVPFSLYELGLLYKQQGDFQKASRFIENAKQNYKGYSMESRLHFRIHAALNSLRGSPATTP
ncbi:Tetratricopeptide repeat protein 39B [Acipenser ruthenus]|uniref:Tetratricopeptide repeat protein 39B n=1 Tax=Acipenser ruthenus TaxID=7906 RepID=A0A444UI32_ACIRT|nr:Tetratricopeptide repeat protein 39B [Acipenser ruthenus]